MTSFLASRKVDFRAPVNGFIDRQYYGIYYIREKLNDTFVSYRLDRASERAGTAKETSVQNTVIINALLQNRVFRDTMLKRVAWHMRNTFEPSRVIARLDSMADTLRHDVV